MEVTNSAETIDATNYPESPSHWKGATVNVYDKNLCQDNKCLTDFINKCLVLEPSIEMERIINNVLLPVYCNADSGYKKSDQFKKVLSRAFRTITNNPGKKYNQICGIFETLKVHTMSDTDFRKKHDHNVNPKKRKLDVIDLGCDDDDDIMVVGNQEVGATHDKAETENDDPFKDSTVEIQDSQELNIEKEMQTNGKNSLNSMVIDTPGLASIDTSEVDNNGLIHKKKANKKKRVDLITLSTTASANGDTDLRKRPISNKNNDKKVSPKRTKHDVINLDSDDDGINSEVVDNIVNNSIEIKKSLVLKIGEEIQTSDERNANNLIVDTPIEATVDAHLTYNNDTIIEIQDSQELKITGDNQIITNIGTEVKGNVEDIDSSTDTVDKFLVPQLVQVEEKEKKLDEAEKAQMIQQIEAKIANFKEKILELESCEVTDDTEISPYIQCHRLEARIVKLYNKLCELVESEPAKSRKVRFHISEGQPEGPIRRLEEFLNEKVDAEGVAPFPDFEDVVSCVEKANEEDGLGWSKPQIMNEAKEIFIYCGRALQNRRQHREYKHMRARVPREAFDDDPAERDAELMAKLELNKKIAKKKEKEMLKRHCRKKKDSANTDVQTEDQTTVTSSFFGNHENETNVSDEPTAGPSDNEPTAGPSNNPKDLPTEKNTIVEEDCANYSENHGTGLDGVIVQIKQEPIEIPQIQYKGDISLVIEISDSESSDDEDTDASSVEL